MVTLRKMEDGYEVIAADGTEIGFTYRDPDQAWSYAPWVIGSDYSVVKGGVNGAQNRRRGFRTRADAVREIYIMNSAKICAEIAPAQAEQS